MTNKLFVWVAMGAICLTQMVSADAPQPAKTSQAAQAEEITKSLVLSKDKGAEVQIPDDLVVFVTEAVLANKYLDVKRDEHGQVTIGLGDKPSVGLIVRAMEIHYDYLWWQWYFDKKNNEHPGLLHTAAYIAAKVDEARQNTKLDQSTIELGKVLYAMLNEYPKNMQLQKAGDKYVSTLAFGQELTRDLAAQRDDVRRALMAARMGLKVDTFDWDRDFEKFLVANNIDAMRQKYQHSFDVGLQGDPMILVEGKLQPWEWVKPRIQLDDKMKMTNYVYTYEGLVPGNSEKDIIAYDLSNPPRYGNNHILELVWDGSEMMPHVWVRLYDADGKIYSAGWVGKGSWVEEWWRFWATDAEEGVISSPDPLDKLSVGSVGSSRMVVTPIGLSAEEFQKALDFLHEYQNNPNACYEGQTAIGTAGCGSFVRTIMQQLGFNTPPGTWWHGVEDPTTIYSWMQRENASRGNEMGKLREKHADNAAFDQVRYRKPPKDI